MQPPSASKAVLTLTRIPIIDRATIASFVNSDEIVEISSLNTMRFDHDPITLAPKGLLIEQARVNELFTVIPLWEGVTVETGSAVSPADTMDAFKVLATKNSGLHTLAYQRSISAGTYTFFAFVKAAGETSVMLQRVNSTQIVVNLVNGSFVVSSPPRRHDALFGSGPSLRERVV